jgi:tetratricopeptide (TPR) repeat protein
MFIPIDEANIPADERVELEAFVGTLNTEKRLRFNFSFACHKVLHHLFENAPEQAMICTYDMGFIQKDTCPEVGQLYGTFGACMFFSIFFPHLAYIAQKFGFEACFTDYTEGQSQMGIFFKGIPVPKLQATFHRVFHEEGGEKAFKVQRSLVEMPSNKEAFTSELSQSMSQLSPKEKESYTLLYGIAQGFQKRGGLDEAKSYADQLIKLYGRSAITAQYLKADVLNDQGHHQDALQCLSDAIEAAPSYYRLHHLKALISGSHKQYNMFLESAKASLKYAPNRESLLWDHLLTMALVYLELQQTRKSRDIFMWISNTELHFPGILPSTLVKRATAISKQFEGFLK